MPAERPGGSRRVAEAPARAGAPAISADPGGIAALLEARHPDPFAILGLHEVAIAGKRAGTSRAAFAVRAILPGARTAAVKVAGALHPMERYGRTSFFEAVVPNGSPTSYQLVVTDAEGRETTLDDPYRFPPVLGELDLHLFNEGTHLQLYRRLGAQVMTHQGVQGTSFAFWAPNAWSASVIGSFNRWDARRHPMRMLGSSGVWELFVPGVGPEELYKFHVRTRAGGTASAKADPVGFAMEVRPRTASMVWDLGGYRWKDDAWMASRTKLQGPGAPLSIYEVHLGSWRRNVDEELRWLTYRELAAELVPYAKRMGYTHLELLPVSEHPFDGSWGYQTTGYFAPTSRFGSPDDFRFFIDKAHRAGLGVILDWVPAHFPKDEHALARFDGTHLYEHADPRKGHHKDWDTLIFDLGRPEVCAFLISNALYWLDLYHIDGLRVDAVASMLYLDYSRKAGEWVPNRFGGRENLEAIAFFRRFNEAVHARYPDVLTIAEESTAWPGVSHPVAKGGLGFDIKWNMGWMHDTLGYFHEEPIHRRFHQQKLTFSLQYAFSERFLLPLSHDEVVHGKRSLLFKMPGDAWRKHANLRLLHGYQMTHPGKKLLFMGGELGQRREWSHDRQLDWELLDDPRHQGMQKWVRDLNALYRSRPALHAQDFSHEGFQWIDFSDEANSVVSYVRRDPGTHDFVVVAANFTPTPQEGYRVGVPEPGKYRALLNSDDHAYGGSGVGPPRLVGAEEGPWQGQRFFVTLTLPPLGMLVLERNGAKRGGRGQSGREAS